MTYLILAQQKISSWYFPARYAFYGPELYAFFQMRMLGIVLAGLLGGILIFYGVSLYATFDLGFQIRHDSTELRNAKIGLEEKELEAQSVLSTFASEHKVVLESMEKISAIKYLIPQSVVTSQASAIVP